MEELSDNLLNSLKSGKKVFESFTGSFRDNYLISGKSIKDWELQFRIKIPADLTAHECKELDRKILDLHQEASFYKASARAVSQALKKGSDTSFKDKFNELVADYKTNPNVKLPAAKTLELLAKANMDDVDTATMAASIAVDFWQDILDHLAFCRKLIENLVIIWGIEAKQLR